MKTPIDYILIALALLSTLNAQLSTVFAQGTAFTYQGRLTDGTNPANGHYDLRFAIYDAASAGARQGSLLTNSTTAVTNGLFAVTLDFGNQFPGAARWLEIAVRTNSNGAFTTLTPRQQITPTPYAVYSEGANAAGLTGTIPMGGLSGTYGDAVTLGNAGNNFSGNGAGLTALNASQLTSGIVPDARLSGNVARTNQVWLLGGNSGTTPGTQFMGTKDNQPLELRVNGVRALRLEPNTNGAPNVVGGSPVNFVANGVFGAVIGGGGATNDEGLRYTNSVTDDCGTVGGGAGNTASGSVATVGGGLDNVASSNSATVSGGSRNLASGPVATVAGGEANIASGYWATVGGGYFNTAAGWFSFAAGEQAQALHNNSFVWSDGSGGSFSLTAANQFSVRAAGGVVLAGNVQIEGGAATYHHVELSGGNSYGYLYGSFPAFGDGIHMGYNYYADSGGLPGHVINAGGGTSRISAGYDYIGLGAGDVNTGPLSDLLVVNHTGVSTYSTFNNNSDRNAKQDFTSVSPAQILDKVLQLPVSEWSYKVDSATRHIGAMAQDFYAAFNVGTDDKHIAPIDEGGVALAAIQGLNQKVDSENAKLTEELKRRNAENAELKQRLEALEKIVRNQKPN